MFVLILKAVLCLSFRSAWSWNMLKEDLCTTVSSDLLLETHSEENYSFNMFVCHFSHVSILIIRLIVNQGTHKIKRIRVRRKDCYLLVQQDVFPMAASCSCSTCVSCSVF